jgi:hypothetical protein
MPMTTPRTRLLLVYGAAALCITWPAVQGLGTTVPGAERSDLWNSLWSLWFFQHNLLMGASPFGTDLLGFPDGGSLAVADPVSALAGLALVPAVGLVASYNLLVIGQLVFSGWAAHRLAELLAAERAPGHGPWVAGLGFMAAPVIVSAVHNGTSEAIAGGWLPLSLLTAILALRRAGVVPLLLAGLTLGAALWSSWYLGFCALLGVGSLWLVGEGSTALSLRSRRLGPALVLGVLVAAPLAWAQHRATTAADSLVGIKGAAELALVRRMTGAADPLAFFVPGDFRSPDFRELSRYGEDFIHCPYLGWMLLLGAGLALARVRCRRGGGWLVFAGLAGAALAMGPVLVRDGYAVLLSGDRVLPLPYLLLERLPGLSSMSLVFRIAMLSSLALALLAARGFEGLGRRPALWAVIAALLVFAELRLLSPVAGLPACSDTSAGEPLRVLARAPEGAVMNFPVVGGRRYLYEQTIHGKPITGGLNFPSNAASRRVWSAILEAPSSEPARYRQRVEEAACLEGVGYLVVHVDPMARPDMHDRGVRALHHTLPVLAEAQGIRVHSLCPASSAR